MFKQKDGLPMGDPSSPIISDFFMRYLETQVILPSKEVKFYRRFVDDTFAVIRRGSLPKLLEEMNSFDPNIQFTFEEESNYEMNFLDVTVIRQPNGSLKKKVYRKPTHTGRYLNYSSFHHHSHKISVIDSLLYRAFSISDAEFLEDEINHVTSDLRRNGYPLSLIQRRIEKRKEISSMNTQERKDTKDKNQEGRFTLPYIGPFTSAVSRTLRKRLNCDFGYIPGSKIGQSLCNHKEKPPPCEAGVYRIPCSNCNDLYIGETGRTFMERMKEHQRDISKQEKKSPLVTHLLSNPGHDIKTESATLFIKETRHFQRKFLEGIHIRKTKNRMNQDLGMDIHPVWTGTLLPLINNIP